MKISCYQTSSPSCDPGRKYWPAYREAIEACAHGRKMHELSIQRGYRQNLISNGEPLKKQMMGAYTEMSVQRSVLGIHAPLTMDTFKSIPDVGPYEVRSRNDHYDFSDLIFRPDDYPIADRIFINTTTTFFEDGVGMVWIRGYCWGYEARKFPLVSRGRNKFGEPFPACHWVPNHALHPISDLVRIPKLLFFFDSTKQGFLI